MIDLKWILLFMMLIPIAYSQQQVDYYTDQPLGKSIEGGVVDTQSSPLDPNIQELQVSNAESETQLMTAQTVHEIKKKALLEQADEGWDLIIGLLKLLMDTFVLLMYVFEMRLLLYLFVELIPDVFVKIRDSLVNWELSRRTK